MELFTFKRCFAFFAESSHAFLLVSRGEAEAEDFSFISDTGYDVAVDAAVDGSFGELYCNRSVLSDLLSQFNSSRHQFFLREDFVDQADSFCFFSVDHAARVDEFFSVAAAYDTGQALCAAEARSDAQADFRLAEFSVFSCIADIASAGEFAAAAESEAVDSCDDRLRQVSISVKTF